MYHAVGSTLCLFLPVPREPTREFYRGLDALVGPHLTNMSADLMDVFNTSGGGHNGEATGNAQVLW